MFKFPLLFFLGLLVDPCHKLVVHSFLLHAGVEFILQGAGAVADGDRGGRQERDKRMLN